MTEQQRHAAVALYRPLGPDGTGEFVCAAHARDRLDGQGGSTRPLRAGEEDRLCGDPWVLPPSALFPARAEVGGLRVSTVLADLDAAAGVGGENLPVRAVTPHGTYVFEVVAVEAGPDGPLLRLREVAP